MVKMAYRFAFVFALIGALLITGCISPFDDAAPSGGNGGDLSPERKNASALNISYEPQAMGEELKKFESGAELEAWLAENRKSAQRNYYGDMAKYESAPEVDFLGGMVTSETAPAPTSAQGSSGGVDYSTTNVQVEGVDEADIIKTDGKYIYLIHGGEFLIVDAKGADSQIITRMQLYDKGANYRERSTPEQMFVSGDRLVLFASAYKKEIVFPKYSIEPTENYEPVIQALVFDMHDRRSPVLQANVTVSGDYYQSRMAGDEVYLISQETPAYYGPIIMPYIEYDYAGMAGEIAPPVYYFDHPEEEYVFNTITTFGSQDGEVIDAKTFLLGYSNTFMMSQDNLYIAYKKYAPWNYWWAQDETNTKERFFSVVVPLLPAELEAQILETDKQDKSDDEKWDEIEKKLSDYFGPYLEKDAALSDGDIRWYKELMRDISDALAEYDALRKIEDSQTIIHKFSANEGKIEYVAKGAVDGYLLNQFSMDEYGGKLRVATTVDVWAAKHVQYNNVFVLDENMEEIGSLERVARDEKIYSARFMGERLYLVTFKKMDPFFVIDLAEPAKPEILGALKIPGYSDYLHPFGENYIIGIGKATEEADWGGVVASGVKIALFDVQNPANPKEVGKVEIGDRGSDSAVLHDHKAFLLDATRGIMVIPIKETEVKEGWFADRTNVWNGAYAFEVSKESGFEKMGTVEHSSSDDYWSGWWDSATVSRSLYIGDELYTLSDDYLKINKMENGLSSLGSIELPGEEEEDVWDVPILKLFE